MSLYHYSLIGFIPDVFLGMTTLAFAKADRNVLPEHSPQDSTLLAIEQKTFPLMPRRRQVRQAQLR
jgi:hypothetical protein